MRLEIAKARARAQGRYIPPCRYLEKALAKAGVTRVERTKLLEAIGAYEKRPGTTSERT